MYKTLIPVALLASSVAATPVAADTVQDVTSFEHRFYKRQVGEIPGVPKALAGLVPFAGKMGMLPGILRGINKGYGKVAEAKGAGLARVVNLPTRNSHIEGSKTVKIRYGPYKVPSSTKKNGLGEAGMLFNYPDPGVAKPCAGDCVLLGMNADLEFADGSNANNSNGMWLHHMVLFNGGPKRFDPTCVGQASLPHYLVSSDPSKSERLLASGNERTTTRFNSPLAPKDKLGYFLNKADKFSLIVDFMNEKPQDKTVYMTITYDYVDGRPAGFSNYRTIWLDVAQCGTSEVAAPKQSGQFVVQQTWNANLNGDIIGAGGHLHDGGVRVAIEVDGKEVCDSRATYAKGGPGGMSPGMGGGGMSMGGKRAVEGLLGKRDPQHGVAGGDHISAMSMCGGSTMGIKRVEKGQKWVIKGYYDYDKHPGMKTNGKQTNVMAIAMMMIKNWDA